VETYKTDIFRDALIGFAPLLAGMTVLAAITIHIFGMILALDKIDVANLEIGWNNLSHIFNQSDFWLWMYIVFVISSTMYPSASDRRSWIPIIILLGTIVFIAILFGAGSWMVTVLAPRLNQVFLGLAIILGLSTFTHFVLLIPLWMLRTLIVRITKMSVA
jgi:hypothetical protein